MMKEEEALAQNMAWPGTRNGKSTFTKDELLEDNDVKIESVGVDSKQKVRWIPKTDTKIGKAIHLVDENIHIRSLFLDRCMEKAISQGNYLDAS